MFVVVQCYVLTGGRSVVTGFVLRPFEGTTGKVKPGTIRTNIEDLSVTLYRIAMTLVGSGSNLCLQILWKQLACV